jgi:hypothetical protein
MEDQKQKEKQNFAGQAAVNMAEMQKTLLYKWMQYRAFPKEYKGFIKTILRENYKGVKFLRNI